MLLRRRALLREGEYVKNGLLLYLDGRDAPTGSAWVDRVNDTPCTISGIVDHLPAEKCYYRDSAYGGYIALPNELLLNTNLYTVQVVGNQIVSNNQAFISIHAYQNGKSQFSIWPSLGADPGNATIQYYTYNNGYSYGYRVDLGLNRIHSMSGSRNGGSTCKSFCDGVFDVKEISQKTADNSRGNTLFAAGFGSWNNGIAKIYSVRIYDRVLSNDEILDNYKLDVEIFKAL